MSKKSAVRDLIFRIEGYGDEPDYEIRSIARIGGRIIINITDKEACHEPQERTETKPETAAAEQTHDGGQTEQGAAE